METGDYKNPPPWSVGPMVGVMERVQALIDLKKWDQALEALNEALAREPDSAHLHFLLGLCHYHRSHYEPARKAAKQAIALAPQFDEAFWLLASVALQQDRHREGLQAIETALELDSENPLYLATRGALLLNNQRPREAMKAAEAALAIDPHHDMASHVRALALTELGRHPEANELAIASLARDPESATAWYLRGLQLTNQGKVDEAKAALLESLRLDPENAEAQDALLRVMGTKHPFFALFWRWSFFLYRFPPGARWGIILGLWALVQVTRGLARAFPVIMPFVAPLLITYALFCIYTWVAMPLFKLAIKWRWIR
jgi:tetratricopeptide (TPR) repeat protein